MEKSVRIQFHQILRLNAADLERTSCGFIKLPVRVSRVGVMIYKDGKGKSYPEFKPPEELFREETKKSLCYIPVTDKHPKTALVRPYNVKELSVGMVVDEGKEDMEYFLSSSMVITDQKVIDRICDKFNKGETQEVSAGYEAQIHEEPGIFNGEKYVTVQRDVVFNHLALVDLGRAGPDVKIVFPVEGFNTKADNQDFCPKDLMISEEII